MKVADPVKFRLREFQDLARFLDKTLPLPLAFFLKGWLFKLEDWYITVKIKGDVDQAIKEYKDSLPPVEEPEPIFIETESEVEGLPILELHAPYERTTTGDTDKE